MIVNTTVEIIKMTPLSSSVKLTTMLQYALRQQVGSKVQDRLPR